MILVVFLMQTSCLTLKLLYSSKYIGSGVYWSGVERAKCHISSRDCGRTSFGHLYS